MPDPEARTRPRAGPLSALSRRRFVRAALMAAGALAAAASVPAMRSGPFPPVSGSLRHLDARRAGIVRAVGRALIGSDVGRVPVEEVVDGTLGAMDAPDRELWLRVLDLLEAGTFLTWGRLKPFSELDPAEATRYLASWWTSSIPIRRTMYIAVRKAVLASWYMDPRAWPVIGYRGPWVRQFHVPRVPLRFPLRDPVAR